MTIQYLALRLNDFIFPEQIFHDANSLSESETLRLVRNAQLLRLIDQGLIKCSQKCHFTDIEPEDLIFDEIGETKSFNEPFLTQLLGIV